MQIELKILNKEFFAEESEGVLLHPLPSFATSGSAGIDLYSTEDVVLAPGEVKMVATGLAIHINTNGIMGMIVPRSGLGHNGLILGNTVGIIDSDYQGEIKISAWNRNSNVGWENFYEDEAEELWIGKEPYEKITEGCIGFNRGERIAQMIFIPYVRPNWKVVEELSNATDRGEGGFGSTGQ